MLLLAATAIIFACNQQQNSTERTAWSQTDGRVKTCRLFLMWTSNLEPVAGLIEQRSTLVLAVFEPFAQRSCQTLIRRHAAIVVNFEIWFVHLLKKKVYLFLKMYVDCQGWYKVGRLCATNYTVWHFQFQQLAMQNATALVANIQTWKKQNKCYKSAIGFPDFYKLQRPLWATSRN